ncbi:MAG: hypothetical protein ABIQ04_02830 [Candidatus Saccharimonadales bacterium]
MNYKQQSNQGCLIVDLMYLFGEKPTRETEEELLSQGLFNFRENFTLGCLMAFLNHFPNKRAKIYFDNKYYLDILKAKIDHPRLEMVLGRNDQILLDKLSEPYIVYVDNHITDGYTHLPHFMMVTSSAEKMFSVFDPWDGKTIQISKQKLVNGISLLRDHIKICPFVITAA